MAALRTRRSRPIRLTGVPASELTSLGCHTDLWSFETDLYSSLVVRQGWLDKMPGVRPASEVLGLVLPALGAELGLKPRLPVHVGIHDSNASLLPHLGAAEAPFTVVSTGTWTILMTVGGEKAWVTAHHPGERLLLGYIYNTAEFPWMQTWESYPKEGMLARAGHHKRHADVGVGVGHGRHQGGHEEGERQGARTLPQVHGR